MNCCDYNCHQGRNCPARMAPNGKRVDVSRVQLDGTHSKGRKATGSALAHMVKRALQLVAAIAVLAIWAAASMATQEVDGNAQKRTSWMEAA